MRATFFILNDTFFFQMHTVLAYRFGGFTSVKKPLLRRTIRAPPIIDKPD